MRFRRIDHVVTVIDPVTDELFHKVRWMLAITVHEQHGAAPGMVQSRHQRGFLAEVARQRHHLNIERIGGKPARDGKRRIGAAVVNINDLAGQPIALAQRLRQPAKPLVQKRKPRRLVVEGHHDRQPLRRGRRRGR